jgi:hypothetical protein
MIMDKFAPDSGPKKVLLYLLNPLVRVVATSLLRSLKELILHAGLSCEYEERFGLWQLFSIVRIRKKQDEVRCAGR